MVAVRTEVDAGSNSAGITLTTDTAPQVGDTACLVQWNDYYAASNLQTPTGGLTWTLQVTADGGTNARHVKVWTAPITSAGAQTVTVNSSTTDEERYAALFILVGAVSYDAAGTFTDAAATSTSHVAPSVTTTSTDGILICTWFAFSAINYTMPGSMTGYTEYDVGGSCTYRGASEALSAAGGTGTRTATSSVSAVYSAHSFALKGAGGGATAIPGRPQLYVPRRRAANW